MKLITNIQPLFLPDILFKQSNLKKITAAVAYCKDYRLFEYCKKHKIKLNYYGRLDSSVNLNLKKLKNFLTDGISIHIIGGTKFHPKVIQCYGYGAYIGSANLTESAWKDNIECGLWLTQKELEDNCLTDQLNEFFKFIQKESKSLSDISDQDISELDKYKPDKFENPKASMMIKEIFGKFEGCSKKEHSDIEPQSKKDLQSDHKTKNQGDTMLKSINKEEREEGHKQLKQKMLRTFESRKNIKLSKRSRNLYFDKISNIGLCVMISKEHDKNEQNHKYWFTLTAGQKKFLNDSREGYVFLGFLDNYQKACLVPYKEHRKSFEGDKGFKRKDIYIGHHGLDKNSLGINLSEFIVPLK